MLRFHDHVIAVFKVLVLLNATKSFSLVSRYVLSTSEVLNHVGLLYSTETCLENSFEIFETSECKFSFFFV